MWDIGALNRDGGIGCAFAEGSDTVEISYAFREINKKSLPKSCLEIRNQAAAPYFPRFSSAHKGSKVHVTTDPARGMVHTDKETDNDII